VVSALFRGFRLEPTSLPADTALVGAQVLVIDDQPDIRRILAIGLEAEGYEVRTAGGAVDGLDLVCTESPAVVILDLMMPARDGWSFLRELENVAVRRPAVIILSARSGEGERLLARRLGAAEYVTKPFEMDHIARLVSRYAGSEGDALSSAGTPG
jgi:DNA-binding response OmpR family regulator